MSDRKGPFGRFPKEIRVMMESFEGLEDPRQTRGRRHRLIENNLHWVLDVTFTEDHCRARKLNAAHNFALVRQVLLGLLNAETSVKRSIAKKRSRCAWGPETMLTVLAAAD